MFSLEYFNEIYEFQFMKVLKALLVQLMELKKFKNDQIEIFDISNLN